MTKRTPGRRGGVPPIANRFKPGQSGNPLGRPRGSGAISRLLQEEITRHIQIKENGKPVSMPLLSAALRSVVPKALQDTGTAFALIALGLQIDAAVFGRQEIAETNDFTPSDDEIIEEALQRRREEAGHE